MPKLQNNYILVKRKKPNEVVYARKYPKDYKEYYKGNLDVIHPNKLKTWIKFGEAAIKARGKTLEDSVYNVIKEMKGKKITKKEKILVTEEEMKKLRAQAFIKGIEPRYIDILFTTEEKKKFQKQVKVYKIV